MSDVHTMLKTHLLTVAITFLPATTVLAETVGNRFVCELGNEGRVVELTYLDQAGSVPCEIRESKYSDQKRTQNNTLWRADFDLSFCQNQFESYRVKLQTLGWPCEASDLGGNTVHSFHEVTAPEVTLTTTVIDSGIEKQEYTRNANSERQVFIRESEIEDFSLLQSRQVPPEFNEAGVSQRDLDQWIMYLSSQSMLAIQHLAPESESFSNYKLNENLHTEDIYTRLQNRIEYLRSMLSER